MGCSKEHSGRSEEEDGFPGTRCWEPNLDPLEKQASMWFTNIHAGKTPMCIILKRIYNMGGVWYG